MHIDFIKYNVITRDTTRSFDTFPHDFLLQKSHRSWSIHRTPPNGVDLLWFSHTGGGSCEDWKRWDGHCWTAETPYIHHFLTHHQEPFGGILKPPTMFDQVDGALLYRHDSEVLRIEPWGSHSLRVRASKIRPMPQENWALRDAPGIDAKIQTSASGATLINGNITAQITARGKLTIQNTAGVTLLEEFHRTRSDILDPKCSALEVEAREFKGLPGGAYHLTYRLESQDRSERIYGMGQYQQPFLNLKGCDIELAHRNSQASVPFALSSLGYGFLWNNPGVGRAVLGANVMSFEAYETTVLDYWITAGDTPREILATYGACTGTAPMMPEYGLGFWQCKLRYQDAEEVLEVAKGYKHRGLPLDVIVIDFFHWPFQGDWRFDATYWPDADSMIQELKVMGVELMVSVWPSVDKRSENFADMLSKGLLVDVERGIRTTFDFEGDTIHYDATNPEARAYLWAKCKANYYDKGVKLFWLDEAEPEYSVYDFSNYRYYRGRNLAIGNIYPVDYAKTFFEGMTAEGQKNVVNLVRCAWAGSQKFGALVWSGDIASSWSSMRNQLCAGLNMGIAGIPWWTTDIGGFHGGDPDDPAFRELFVRWFQWATFCPVMRLHGDREPRQLQKGTTGGATCRSGAANEVWSYGEDVYDICKTYIELREQLRNYTRQLMEDAHATNAPVMRTCFYEFPSDPKCWEVEDQYMYGPKFLVAPILQARQTSRTIYLPAGCEWQDMDSGKKQMGGQSIQVACSLQRMPVFEKV